MYNFEQLNAIYNSKIGIEFEFFSNLDLVKTKELLEKVLGKNIKIEQKAHSDFSPTYDTFKMEPDNSGGSGMIELVTGSLSFVECKLIIAKVLKWIRENGYTNDKCSIHVNISFDTSKLGPIANISNLDIGKFVLSFDEDKVYELFPNRKDSVYAKSIKYILPLSGMTQVSDSAYNWKNYMFVNEKYYGVNFTKIPKNYIEFRYIGGEDYHLKYADILTLMEHFIISLYNTLTNPKYDKEDLLKLQKVLDKHRKVIKAYKNYDEFKLLFPKINILIDLKSDDTLVKVFYVKIRDTLFDLISKSGLKEGLVNYDSDLSKVQIKDATLDKCFEIKNVDIVESTIQGNIINCDIFSSDIKNSSLLSCNVFGITKVTGSKLEHCYVNKNAEIINSYIFGKNTVFSGKMNGGIFRQGKVTKFADFSKDAEQIEIEKI